MQATTKIDPVKAATEDCDTVVNEGTDPSTLFGRGVYAADEALISAMGRDWVLRAAGVEIDGLVDERMSDAAWQRHGIPWCQAYSAAYEARARTLAADES